MKPITGIEEETLKSNKQCPICGSINAADALSCVNCRNNLSNVTAQPDNGQVATKNSPKYRTAPNVSINPVAQSYNKALRVESDIPMGEMDKIVHLSVDDPGNSDEEHLRSVEESADSLAIE